MTKPAQVAVLGTTLADAEAFCSDNASFANAARLSPLTVERINRGAFTSWTPTPALAATTGRRRELALRAAAALRWKIIKDQR